MAKKELPVVIQDIEYNFREHGGKYYSHTYYCSNCEEQNTVYILKGHLVINQQLVCENCGCEISKRK